MADPTIPFGPGTEPLGLAAASFEFVSFDGPQTSLDNEKMSTKKDGKFLRWAATRQVSVYTANYLILDATAALPAVGLYDASLGGAGGKVWIRNVNKSAPQEGDQTLAVTYAVPDDVDAPEALYADFHPAP